MALGTVTPLNDDSKAIEFLASLVAANGIPTGNAGLSAQDIRTLLGAMPSRMLVGAISTAGSGTMTVTLRVWHRLGALGWFVLKALNASTAAPSTAVAIAETGADTIGYMEMVDGFGIGDRYYLEVVAIGGTSTAVTGYLALGRAQLYS
jgi:hypothetical protein